MTGSPSSCWQGNQCLQSKARVPFPQPHSMGSVLGRACPGLAVRLCPPPRDVLYQGGPIKGTKVLMGCRHPGSALAAGPGLGHRRNPHSQQRHLRSRTEREGAGSRVRLSRGKAGRSSCVRTMRCSPPANTGRRQSARESGPWNPGALSSNPDSAPHQLCDLGRERLDLSEPVSSSLNNTCHS